MQPVHAGRNPPTLPVWHTSIRNHPTDRTLTDAQWGHIAAEMMAAIGLAPHDDPHAVRWIAVRHGPDHIHLVATLVRQDGTTAWAWNERYKAQAAARDLERRYGLHQVGPADHTSHRRPSPAEQNKTTRLRRPEIPRDRLRHTVRAAAAAAIDDTDFFARLRAAGLQLRLRTSTVNPDQVTGYAVGLPDHHTASGNTIWYGGGRLAPDLTLPQLRRRWSQPPTERSNVAGRQHTDATQRAATIRRATAAARHATNTFKTATAAKPDGTDPTASGAYAAADLITATAHAIEGHHGGPLGHAADTFDRAARTPHRRPYPRSQRAAELRAIARLITAMGHLTDDHDTTAALRLVLQLSLLADALADLRHAQHRLHQARAAQQAANELRAFATDSPAASSVHHQRMNPPVGLTQRRRTPSRRTRP